jgi:hypothetical protein
MSEATAAALDVGEFPGWAPNPIVSPLDTGAPRQPPMKVRIPLTDFVSADCHLVSTLPVEVTLVPEEGSYLASNERFQVWAAAETREEAIQDFVQQIVYFHRHYGDRPAESLVGLASRLKTLYAESFTKR